MRKSAIIREGLFLDICFGNRYNLLKEKGFTGSPEEGIGVLWNDTSGIAGLKYRFSLSPPYGAYPDFIYGIPYLLRAVFYYGTLLECNGYKNTNC